MKIQEEREFVGRITDPNYKVVQVLAREAPGAPVLLPRTSEDLRVIEEALEKLRPMFTGIAR